MDSEGEPDISLRTVLTAVNQQSKDIEAIIDAKVTEKIGGLREELQGANQLMKSQVKKLKTDASYKWKYEGNKIQFDFNTENLEDLVQTLWAIDNGKVDYARDLLSATVDKIKHRNKLIKIADTSEGGWDTARQYDANPIASDSEDEAKIIRADNRAVRKKKGKSKQVRGNGSKTKASNQSLLGQALQLRSAALSWASATLVQWNSPSARFQRWKDAEGTMLLLWVLRTLQVQLSICQQQ
ncbi:Hypothetical predicted protein [Mytilus galloprovincialis]|uniref:Uncharacterized protein n=1 Tax=Mytilus galloprovincialis TaxID=29158 RepID=A0A8B6FFS4_MYTGA|nr:Hypothetical predicted protein [Mytilus galloprovincialis]